MSETPDTASEALRDLRIRARFMARARERAEERARRSPEQVRAAALREWIDLLGAGDVLLPHLRSDDLHVCAHCGAIGVDFADVDGAGRFECEACHPRRR